MAHNFQNLDKISDTPLVSVLLCFYNSQTTLERAIMSVLNQDSDFNFELILVNDGSTDDSSTVAEDFNEHHEKIRLVNKRENSGLTHSLNIGISHSNARFIARIDADDIWERHHLQKQVSWLLKNPDYILVGAFQTSNFSGRLIQKILTPVTHEKIRESLCWRNVFIHSSVVFRREVNGNVVLYDSACTCAQDYELFSRLESLGNISINPDPSVSLGTDGERISNKKKFDSPVLMIMT